jgi:hypothetical protein
MMSNGGKVKSVQSNTRWPRVGWITQTNRTKQPNRRHSRS